MIQKAPKFIRERLTGKKQYGQTDATVTGQKSVGSLQVEIRVVPRSTVLRPDWDGLFLFYITLSQEEI